MDEILQPSGIALTPEEHAAVSAPVQSQALPEAQQPLTPQPQEPKKILGLFSDEQELGNAFSTLVDQVRAYEAQLAQFKEVGPQEQPQAQADPYDEQFEKELFIRQRISQLEKAGRLKEANDLAVKMVEDRLGIDKRIEQAVQQKIEQISAPSISRRQFREVPELSHLHEHDDVAITLEQAGLDKQTIVQVMNRLYGAGYNRAAQETTRNSRSYMEEPGNQVDPQLKKEAYLKFRNHWKSVL